MLTQSLLATRIDATQGFDAMTLAQCCSTKCYNPSMQLSQVTDEKQWNTLVDEHPFGHPLQLWQWGELKAGTGWRPFRLMIKRENDVIGAAQMLLWPIPRTGRFVAYVPRGPLVDPESPDADLVLGELQKFAREQRALFLTLEPDWKAYKFPQGWRKSRQPILMPKTLVIDLNTSEDEILGAMKHKTRQYIRKSAQSVKIIRAKGDGQLDDFWRIYSDTAQRAGFALHNREYYQELWNGFGKHNYLYYALVDGKAVAFLWLAAAGEIAFELYGGMVAEGQEERANYTLKWEAIRAMKNEGYKRYDFNGRLGAGVTQFKLGFGGEELDLVGSYDRPFSHGVYALWRGAYPALKQIGRRVRRERKEPS
jgi:peptidoglycan pentaglycine glycine transferase (the first glycine)